MRKFLLVILLLQATQAFSKDFFRIFDLEFSGNLVFYHVEDLNQDNLKDILILTESVDGKDDEKWLSVYMQSTQGFSAKPGQRFKLDNRMIVLDIGDVAGDLNKELVFLMGRELYYYALDEAGFSLQARKLFNTTSIFQYGANHLLAKWDFVADLNADGIDEILLPGVNACQIYFRNLAGATWNKRTLPLAAESRAFGFYDSRFSVGNRASAVYSVPYIFLEDFNADSRKDLMAVYEDSLVVFTQDERGVFRVEPHRVALKQAEIWRGAKIRYNRIGDKNERTFLMKIKDMNNDGIIDAVYLRVSTKESVINPENDIQVYYGKKSSANGASQIYFGSEPDQIIKPGGTQLVLDILDLNNDNRVDLIIPVVKLSLGNLVKMMFTKRAEIEAEIYLMRPNGSFPKKPDLERKMTMRFSYRGGATSPVYEIADFNGDGNLDVMSSLEERQLVFFWGDVKNVFGSAIGEKFNVILPRDGDMVRSFELNGDNKSDGVIQYSVARAAHKGLNRKLRVLLAN